MCVPSVSQFLGLMTCFACELYEYHYVEEKQSWSDAREYCRKHHTDLATLSNMTDVKRLKNSTMNNVEAWIGLHNEGSGNKTWHWSLPGVEYDDNKTSWGSEQPNDYDNNENCVIVNYENKWHDVKCTERKYGFICYDGENIWQIILMCVC